jgi:anaerobic ribonucleoside-triphosphate reductase activating protein
MLLYSTYISIHEVPGEVAIILNIAGCKNNCKGCHSPELRTLVGQPLSLGLVEALLDQYKELVTCICFMGGDHHPEELQKYLHLAKARNFKTCLYTAQEEVPPELVCTLDYVKLGPYVEEKGGLDTVTTNQVFLKLPQKINLNHLFRSNT